METGMVIEEISCERFGRDLEPYLADRLEGDEGAKFRRHRAECADCRRSAERSEPSLLFARIGSGSAPVSSPEDAALFLASVRRGIALKQTETKVGKTRRAVSSVLLRWAAVFAVMTVGVAITHRIVDRPAMPGVIAGPGPSKSAAPLPFPGSGAVAVAGRAQMSRPGIEDLDRPNASVYELSSGGNDDDPEVVFIVDRGMDI